MLFKHSSLLTGEPRLECLYMLSSLPKTLSALSSRPIRSADLLDLLVPLLGLP